MDVKDESYSLNAEGETVRAYLTEDGRQEIVDSTPMQPPVGYRHGPSLNDTVMRLLHQQRMRELEDTSIESPEEADDFDIPDDPLDPLTPWEEHFFQPAQSSPEAVRAERIANVAAAFTELFPERAEAVREFLAGGGGAQPPSEKPVPEPPEAAQVPAKQ